MPGDPTPAILRYLGYNPEPKPEGFGAQLRWKRRALGWCIREAAARNSVDPSTWQQWEKLEGPPKYPRYRAFLIDFMGMPADRLIERIPQVPPSLSSPAGQIGCWTVLIFARPMESTLHRSIRDVQWQTSQVGGRAVNICFVPFAESEFELDCVSEAAIDLPVAIRRSVHRRQAEFFFGRYAARLCMGKYGQTACQIAIGHARQPVWPSGYVGSISHCRDRAAAVVLECGAARGIGIDVEVVRDDQEDALRAIAFNGPEAAYLSSLAGEHSFLTLATLAFSAKECFFKAVFETVGYYFEFDAVRVLRMDFRCKTVLLEVTRTLAPAIREGAMFEAAFSFHAPDVVFSLLLHT